jgi:uncharacterized protein (TIGR03435 family)
VQFPGIRPIAPGGRFTAVGLTPRALMQLAYGRDGMLLETQIVGGADWLDHEQFDIAGTSAALADAANPFATARGLLQTLLRERFKVGVHTDTKTLPAYRLVLARRDGKAGSQLRPAQASLRTGRDAAVAGHSDLRFHARGAGRLVRSES